MNNICLPKHYFLIILLFFVVLTIFHMYYMNNLYKNNEKNNNNTDYQTIDFNNNLFNKNIQSKNLDNVNLNIVNKGNTLEINEKIDLINSLPLTKYLKNRDKDVLYDPFTKPERRVPYEEYPAVLMNDINIPTRGYPDNFQLLGILSRGVEEKFYHLYGRRKFPGSNEWEYYTGTDHHKNKIPIDRTKEIYDGDTIKIPLMNPAKGEFKVKLYDYDKPRYNPFIE
jgi:hypothetical protein